MSRVITFSTQFQKTHPKAGQPTGFVQKVFDSLLFNEEITMSRYCELCRAAGIKQDLYSLRTRVLTPKHHTIRKGNRWKVGDWFSPRVWGTDINPKTGRKGPYQSKQIPFCHDIEIKKIFDIEIDACGVISVNGAYFFDENEEPSIEPSKKEIELAKNDGLSWEDFTNWLAMPVFRSKKPWVGQIISWSDQIQY